MWITFFFTKIAFFCKVKVKLSSTANYLLDHILILIFSAFMHINMHYITCFVEIPVSLLISYVSNFSWLFIITGFAFPLEFIMDTFHVRYPYYVNLMMHFLLWLGTSVSGLSLVLMNLDKLLYFKSPLKLEKKFIRKWIELKSIQYFSVRRYNRLSRTTIFF